MAKPVMYPVFKVVRNVYWASGPAYGELKGGCFNGGLPRTFRKVFRGAVLSEAYTWEDRIKVDDFNCVFWAGKRSRRKQQVGRVSDTSKPLPWPKLFGKSHRVGQL